MLITTMPGMSLSETTATTSDVVAGYTFNNGEGELLTGILPKYNKEYTINGVNE